MAQIRLEKIRKVYARGESKVEALSGVDITVGQNEYVAIMGASGSGKSTLLNILGCLDMPTSGLYELDGKCVSEMDEDELANVRNGKIGFVFQNFNLLNRTTALQNVELPLMYAGVPAKQRRARAEILLERVGLKERLNHRSNELSGGQCQRVAIARALANNPSIILADEPTGNLDTCTSQEVMQIFASLHDQGHTLLLITHEEDIAAHAQRMISIKDGRVESDVLARPETPVFEVAHT